MSRARGPHSAKQTRPDVMSLSSTLPSSGRCRRSHAEVVLPDGRPGDEQEAVRGDAGDGQVALDPAAPVEQLGVDDPADRRRRRRSRTAARGSRRRPARRPRSSRTSVSSNRPAARRVASASAPIAGDQCIPAQPRGRRRLVARRRRSSSNQFGRSQPDFSPKAAPRLGEDVVGRRHPQRPAGLALLVRVVDVVIGRVDLGRPGERVVAATVVPARTAGCPSSRGRARARHRRSSSPSGGRSRPRRRCRGRRTRRRRRSHGRRYSPRMNSLSGVNPSGPLIIRLTPRVARSPGRAGRRRP